MTDSMTHPSTLDQADESLIPSCGSSTLRERVSAPDATAIDWFRLGDTLRQQGGRGAARREMLREALAALVQAYEIDPFCHPTLLSTIAQTAFIVRDWNLLDSTTALLLGRHTADVNALVWRAAVVQQRNDFATAERLLGEAARIAPDSHVVLHKLALCIKEQARFTEAEALLTQVQAMSPDNAHALFDLSELEIRSGRYAEGWAHYESRVAFVDDLNDAQQALAAISAPWRGESLSGKTLVVYGEQGNGDCLWAVRFLPLLAERARREGGRVIFGHDGPLRHLFERMLPPDLPLEATLDTQPDFHCGLMSMPLRLGVVDATGWGAPYLSADPARADAWRVRVDAHMASRAHRRGQRKVGLVWNGNPEHIRDARRSVPVEQLEPLLTVPGITYFALSPGRSTVVEQWRARGIDIVDLTHHFAAGFDDVAALLANLDLVVTIDSGPAHLAGASGVPTCLMIDHVSAWFWGNFGGNVGGDDGGDDGSNGEGNDARRTPWYDSIELFRQPAIGDWASVVESVRERLTSLATGGEIRHDEYNAHTAHTAHGG